MSKWHDHTCPACHHPRIACICSPPESVQDIVSWLLQLASKGGKGVVDNIDARSLGRIADLITKLRAERDAAKTDAVQAHREINDMRFERDAAAREMRERCAEVAADYDGEGMEGGMDAHLGDAFQTRREIAALIRALPDTPAMVATEGESS